MMYQSVCKGASVLKACSDYVVVILLEYAGTKVIEKSHGTQRPHVSLIQPNMRT